MSGILDVISSAAIPVFILVILVSGILGGTPVYDSFVEGAAGSVKTVVRIFPYLAAMMIAVSVFSDTGGMALLGRFLQPVLSAAGVPAELLPMVIVRPLSGSAALGVLSETITKYGADSYIARAASVMMGSTETIFYTVSVYFGAVGVRRSRHALPAALIGGLVGVLSAVWLCRIM